MVVERAASEPVLGDHYRHVSIDDPELIDFTLLNIIVWLRPYERMRVVRGGNCSVYSGWRASGTIAFTGVPVCFATPTVHKLDVLNSSTRQLPEISAMLS